MRGLPFRSERTLFVIADLSDAGRIESEPRQIGEIDVIIAVLFQRVGDARLELIQRMIDRLDVGDDRQPESASLINC